MSAIPSLPPRQRPALSLRDTRALSALHHLRDRPPSWRQAWLDASGLSRNEWQRACASLRLLGLLELERGPARRRVGTYSLTTEGLAEAERVTSEPRDDGASHKRVTSEPLDKKAEIPGFRRHREKEQQASRAEPRGESQPVESQADPETLEQLARLLEAAAALARSLARPGLLHRDLKPQNVTYGPPKRPEKRAECTESPPAKPQPGALVQDLRQAIGRPSHPDLEDVAQALEAEGVAGEDAVAFARVALDKPAEAVRARYPSGAPNRGALVRGLAREGLPPGERAAALGATEPPAAKPYQPTEGERARLSVIDTKLRVAPLTEEQRAKLEAEAQRLRSGAAGAA